MGRFVVVLSLVAASASAGFELPRGLTLECNKGECFVTGESRITDDMLVEGDIIDDETEGRNAVSRKDRLWPDGIIPYVFHSDFRLAERQRIEYAMKSIMKKTCVKFVPWTEESPQQYYVVITAERGCRASVGFNQMGNFRVNLNPLVCLRKLGKIQHELIHLTGFYHEHSRPDRDKYVEIKWENVAQGRERNFVPSDEAHSTTLGVPYNYLSVMHYPADAFSKNGKPTIVPKANINPSLLGQRRKATYTDIQKINLLYNCDL